MRTIDKVRPELRGFLESAPVPTMDAAHLAAIRAAPRPPTFAPETAGVTVETRHAEADGAPPVRLLVYRPARATAAMPAVLHIHGGGFVLGAPEMSDGPNRVLASRFGMVVVSVDYRLAPETPFPGPLEDCYAALRWLHAEAAGLGVDPARIAVKGESAGGGLAAGLALLARDRGALGVAFQCLSCPMIDDRQAADPHPFAGEFVWNPESDRFGWGAYLCRAPGGGDVSPYAAPARAADLAGLPPAWIMTSGLDLFVEHDLEYARRLCRAGVDVDLVMYPGAYHGFHMAGDTAISRRYYRDCHEALVQALRPAGLPG